MDMVLDLILVLFFKLPKSDWGKNVVNFEEDNIPQCILIIRKKISQALDYMIQNIIWYQDYMILR